MEINIPIEELSRRGELYGVADRNLRLIRAAFNVQITARDGTIRVGGADDDVRRAGEALERLQRSLRGEVSLTESVVQDAIQQAIGSRLTVRADAVGVYLASANIVPKGNGQRDYIEAILKNDLTFCVGPAGTGKTYLAVAVSVSLLKQQRIKRIVLVRPAVEAGEKLGYLPGDIQAKVNPYLRPLFDAMNDMMGYDQLKRFIQNDVIEVMPLAFMRGRTLNQAAVILDEAQNATAAQMLMFLTRLGNHSKMIVTGDDSQSDLSSGAPSGLLDAMRRLDGEAGVGAVRLTPGDIVRHPLVQRVVDAYANNEPGV